LLEENLSRSTRLCNGFYLFQIRTAVDSVEAMHSRKSGFIRRASSVLRKRAYYTMNIDYVCVFVQSFDVVENEVEGLRIQYQLMA
jgi:hypothetical protein